MANFPILKMINIDGRQVPFVYPQHKKEVGGYAETGEDNPLPTYDKTVSQGINELKTIVEKRDNKVVIDNQPTDYPDLAVKQELELIKQENTEIKQAQSDIISALQTSNENLQSTNEALLSVIKDNRLQSDTQLTGSIVEHPILTEENKLHVLVDIDEDFAVSPGSKIAVYQNLQNDKFTSLYGAFYTQGTASYDIIYEERFRPTGVRVKSQEKQINTYGYIEFLCSNAFIISVVNDSDAEINLRRRRLVGRV